MSNENENRIGSGSPLEKPIKIYRDFEGEISAIISGQVDGIRVNPKDWSITGETNKEVKLSLREALRVIEATVKFLNQTKNEGRNEARTIKDKENQHKLNQIRDELVDEGFNNITMVEAYKKISRIMSIKFDKENIPLGPFGFDIDKIKENQKLINAVIEIAKTGSCTMTMGLVNGPKFDSDSFTALIEHVTSNPKTFCKSNYRGLIKDL